MSQPSSPGRFRQLGLVPSAFRTEGAASAMTLGGGTAIGQAIAALSAPILTRLYTPGEFGLVGLVVTLVSFAGVGLSLRFDLAIVTAVDDGEADTLLAVSLFLALAVTPLVSVLLIVLILTDTLSYGTLPLWSVLFALPMLVFVGAFGALRYWYVRRGGFRLIAGALIAQGIGRSVVSVAAGLLALGWGGLLAGEMVGRALGVGRMLTEAWPVIWQQRSKLEIRNALWRNRKYPSVVLPSSLLDSAAGVIAVPIVISLFGAVSGGEFFLVQNLLGLPAGFIASGVADVLHGRLAKAFLADGKSVFPVARRALGRLTAIAICIYFPIAIAAPFVAGPLLGASWERAGIVATLLTPIMITGLVVNPVSRVLFVVNRAEWKLGVDLLRLVLPPITLLFAHNGGWGFLSALSVYSLARSISNGVYIGVVWFATKTVAEGVG